MKVKTGVSGANVKPPTYRVRALTGVALEALVRGGNEVSAGESCYMVTLSGDVPVGLVVGAIPNPATGAIDDESTCLRMMREPRFWNEHEPLSWACYGQWLPCPACGAALVWFEAGYVPGYRICVRKPHHHAMLSSSGKTATSVT